VARDAGHLFFCHLLSPGLVRCPKATTVTEAQALRASFEIDQKAGKFVIFSDLTR
jgi:hypothetical protein